MTTKNRTTRNGEKDGRALSLALVQADFVACGRCSYFLAGYRVLHGLPALENAIAASDGEWLILAWNEATRRLMQKSFGCRIDNEWYHYETCCPVCYRRFQVTTAPEPQALETAEAGQAEAMPAVLEPAGVGQGEALPSAPEPEDTGTVGEVPVIPETGDAPPAEVAQAEDKPAGKELLQFRVQLIHG